MTLSEKYRTITAAELGIRLARQLYSNRSSFDVFTVQQAFKDCEDDLGLFWEPLKEMLERITGEPEPEDRP